MAKSKENLVNILEVTFLKKSTGILPKIILHSAASDLGLQFLLRPAVSIFRIIKVYHKFVRK